MDMSISTLKKCSFSNDPRRRFMLHRLLFFCFIIVFSAFGQDIIYMHPLPDARYVSDKTTILFKTDRPVSAGQGRHINVRGEKSGRHPGKIRVARDRRTVLFIPNHPFAAGEKVLVSAGFMPDKYLEYTFWVAAGSNGPKRLHNADRSRILSKTASPIAGTVRTINGVAVPSDFPLITAKTSGETAPGRIFFASTFTGLGNYLVICENDGTPYWYRRYERTNLGSGDFKVQPSGILTAYLYKPSHYIALDRNFEQIAVYKCGHGYHTDSHECVVLPGGHALLVGEDKRQVDMSKIVSGGNKFASVIGNHVQEVDADGHVYFEWRSWDHFRVQDAVHENLQASSIDYVHLNSIAVDHDGHYIISSRHLSEVSKINKDTGDFIWRFGGVHNQFTLKNTTVPISYQHHVRPVPDKPGHYTIYDNGNHRDPGYTRAVEFKIDAENKTAELVWAYRYTPDRTCRMMGSVQRLPNGHTFIDWSTNPPLRACEVTPEGEIVFEIEATGTSSYRSGRYVWDGQMKVPYLLVEPHKTKVVLIFNKFGDPAVDKYFVYAGPSFNPQKLVGTTTNTFMDLVDLPNHTTWHFRVRAGYPDGSQSPYSESKSAKIDFIEPGGSMVLNGDFSAGRENWAFSVNGNADAQGRIDKNGRYHINITRGGSAEHDIQLFQGGMELVRGQKYRFEFDAYAGFPRTIEAKIEQATPPYKNYGKIGPTPLQSGKARYAYEFTMQEPSDYTARVVFYCGKSMADVYLDNVVFKQVFPEQVKALNTSSPPDYGLDQNYPNPFNQTTVLPFSLAGTQWVSLDLFDLTGRHVRTILQQQYPAGHHSVTVKLPGPASGIYFYQIRAGDFSAVRKMVHVR